MCDDEAGLATVQRSLVPNRLREQWAPRLLALATIGLVARLLVLVHRYAVNVLFYDQWDFYNSLFNGSSWLAMFRWQHGPHRQGCGLFLSRYVAQVSGWNTRTEAFVIAFLVIAALGLALVLKKRFVGHWDWTDAAISLFFLAPIHYELFVGTPNPAHGALPVLLLMAYSLAWTIPHLLTRYGVVLLLNLLLVYTGFGCFMGLITPVVMAGCCLREYRDRRFRAAAYSGGALLCALLTSASFLIGYTFSPATDRFRFWHTHALDYLRYAAVMWGNALGVKDLVWGTVLGSAVMLAQVAITVIHGRSWFRNGSPASLAIAVFAVFSVLFSIATAYGRVDLGLETAHSSRYAIYLVPGLLAVYLCGTRLQRGEARAAFLAAFLASALYACGPVHDADTASMKWYSEGKQRWKAAYLASGSVEQADQQANFLVYPCPANTHLTQKLDYLRERHLNLFRKES